MDPDRAEMNPNEYLVSDPNIAGGEIVFKDKRVPLRTVLASLAEGDSYEELLRAFPTLRQDHVRAAVAFSANSALEDQPVPAVPRVR